MRVQEHKKDNVPWNDGVYMYSWRNPDVPSFNENNLA